MEKERALMTVIRRGITMMHTQHIGGNAPVTHAVLAKIQDKEERLLELDNTIFAAGEASDEDLTEMEKYRDMIIELKSIYTAGTTNESYKKESSHYKRRLPELSIPSFSGDISGWIAFWGQFKKVDEDEKIRDEDKFMYLTQNVSGKAKTLIDSYPPSGENYSKALTALKNRYAQDHMLIDFYVRKLHNIMISEITQKQKRSLAELYDELMSNLNNLESLNLPTSHYTPFLLPLIESCLPVSILQAWERNRFSSGDSDSSSGSLLGSQQSLNDTKPLANDVQKLMLFLQREVESEEKIKHAKASVGTPSVMTASDLLNTYTTTQEKGSDTGKCVPIICLFCTKSHSSQDCIKAQHMSLEQRKTVIKMKKACFICLRTNHSAKVCKSFVKCPLCQRKHYILLCPELTSLKKVADKNKETKEESLANNSSNVLLQTLLVSIVTKKGTLVCRCLLDSGCTRSYITQSTAEKLGLKSIGTQTMNHQLFGGIGNQVSHEKYNITLQNIDTLYSQEFIVFSQPKICEQVPRIKSIPKTSNILHNVKLTDIGPDHPPIDILLGCDALATIITGNIQRLDHDLIASETLLGWCVMGKYECEDSVNAISMQNISDLWSLDVLGIKDPVFSLSDELESLEHFKESVIQCSDGRYQVKLPWKQDHIPHNDNRILAEKRLLAVDKRLQQLEKVEDYDKVISQWLSEDIIEEVALQETDSPAVYLPHHPVLKTSTTTKVRPVFDASARNQGGLSVNSCLAKGPNMLETIPSLQTHFRLHKYGVSSDIRQAFLQLKLDTDGTELRFLWKPKGCTEYKILKHKRLIFGLVSSPFLLQATIETHLDKFECTKKLKNRFYVDNFLYSAESEEELNKVVYDIQTVMLKAKLELRQWCCGAPCEVSLQKVKEKFQQEDIQFFEVNEPSCPVLGMTWHTKLDHLTINCKNIKIPNTVTKRIVLSVANKVFDTIGVAAPVSLLPKLLLRKLWDLNLQWDDEIPSKFKKQFQDWLQELHYIEQCLLPRWLGYSQNSNCSIHVFCDSSISAYGTCIFLRSEENGIVQVQLITAKSRLCPTKGVTIPRLELLACSIGTRLFNSIKNALPTMPTTFWTDSMVALCWIQRTNETWKPFVKNRVEEILKSTERRQWRHVPGKDNPADLLSRGCSPKQLYESKWWTGPTWLKKNENTWPTNSEEADRNMVLTEARAHTVSAMSVVVDNIFADLYQRFKSYKRTIRTVAYVLRFIKLLKAKADNIQGNRYINNEEFCEAETLAFKLIQEQYYNQATSFNFQVIKDDKGLLRVKTKLLLGNFENQFKLPVLLPNEHILVEKLIKLHHVMNAHASTRTIREILRERFFINKKFVKRVISKCLVCKKMKSKPCQVPVAPLPADRVNLGSSFSSTGVDLLGPLYLKDHFKVWVALFTCSVYRAIHLEIVPSLSTEDFINALRRFIARRGRPSIIHSDCGTNFKGSASLLNNINWEEVEHITSCYKIFWKFNPPAAPWWGGFWERMVSVVKDLLRKNLGKSTVTQDELYTLLCDIESTINSRPLTYSFENPDELVPLTPMMFIQDIRSSDTTDLDIVNSKTLNGRVKYVQQLREGLRSRFRKEYLAELVQYGKRKVDKIQVGEIVLVEADNVKRLKWPLGRITELIKGADGEVRVAKVKVSGTEIIRPIQRLHCLEVQLESKSPSPAVPPSFIPSPTVSPKVQTENPQQILLPQGVTSRGRAIIKPKKLNL